MMLELILFSLNLPGAELCKSFSNTSAKANKSINIEVYLNFIEHTLFLPAIYNVTWSEGV